MDYILTKINEEYELSDERSLDRFSLSRQRIEYSLIFMLGYMWNKNKDRLSQDEFASIAGSFKNLSLGKLMGNIRMLDKDKTIFKKKNEVQNKTINDYPMYRNNLHGHGFITGDDDEAAGIFDNIYETMIDTIDILKDDIDLITVTTKRDNVYEGILYCAEGGRRLIWSVHEEAFPYKEDYIGSTYARVNGEYYQISPFVRIEEKGNKILIFTSLVDSLSGKIKFARLLSSGVEKGNFKEFAKMVATDDNDRIKSINQTIRNNYRVNYRKYFDANTLVKNKLTQALTKNTSNVCVTLWGHGGVGKTACIQNLIEEFCICQNQKFQYIVFVSAKDRQYNTVSGKIEKLDGGIRTFKDIIYAISKTIFEGFDEKTFVNHFDRYVQRIKEIDFKVLFVIDDFETFEDSEKNKIQDFIEKLDAHYHKVVITTRIKAINIGYEITTAELSREDSMTFLSHIIESEYPKHLKSFQKHLENEAYIDTMYKSTSGRPMFLYQLAHIFASYGYNEQTITSFAQAQDARKFLYDGLYDYLSEKARLIFICISQIVDEQDYTFNYTHLQFLFSEYDSLENEIGEMIKMRVVEFSSSLVYKVYSSEIYRIMKEKYQSYPDEAFKVRLKEQLKQIDLTAKYESVYETWLKQANKEANEEIASKAYSKLVESTSCPQEIREKALINYANYYVKKQDKDSVLKLYEKYERSMRGWHNAIWKFAFSLSGQYDKVIEIIESYFSNEQKNLYKNLDLFSLLVDAKNNEAMLKEVTHAQLANIFNENGMVLFNYAKEKEIYQVVNSELDNINAVRHHMARALCSSIHVLIKLINGEKNIRKQTAYKENALEMCEFGLEHFTRYEPLMIDLYRYQTQIGESKFQRNESTRFEDFVSKHNLTDIYEFYVTDVNNERGFLNGQIDKFNCAIPKWELPRNMQNDLNKYYSKGSKLYVKIKNIILEKQVVHLKPVN